MIFGMEPNTVGLIIIGILTLMNTYYTRKTENNTNSMKDALVAQTKESAHAAGKEEGRVEAKATAALIAEGVHRGENAKKVGDVI